MFKIGFKVWKERYECGVEVLHSSSRLNLNNFKTYPIIGNLKPTSFPLKTFTMRGINKTYNNKRSKIELESGEIGFTDRDEGIKFSTRSCKMGIGTRSRVILDQFRNPLTQYKNSMGNSMAVSGSIGLTRTKISSTQIETILTNTNSRVTDAIQRVRKQRFGRTNLSMFPERNYIKKKYTLFEYDCKIRVTNFSESEEAEVQAPP